MEDTENEFVATLEGQFASFAKLHDWSSPKETISLYCSDYWMRQSAIIDDRRVTMTDTGIIWNKFRCLIWNCEDEQAQDDSLLQKGPILLHHTTKAELNWNEWHEYLSDFCVAKELNKLEIEEALTNCGLPGATRVYVPQYRDFFENYKPKKALIVCESLDSCGKPKKKANKPA